MWLAEAEEPNATDALKTTYVKGTEGLNEHTVDGLNMTHLSAYAVQVRAIDWAGNRAARVRRSDDDSNQRRVVIDTIPPAMSGKPRDVHPGAGRYSVYSYDTAEEDLPAWPARQLACESLTSSRSLTLTPHSNACLIHTNPATFRCSALHACTARSVVAACPTPAAPCTLLATGEWSRTRSADEHSSVVGYKVTLSSDGLSDDLWPWIDAGTNASAVLGGITICPPPPPPQPPAYLPLPPPGPAAPNTTSTGTGLGLAESSGAGRSQARCLFPHTLYHCLVRAYNGAGGYTAVASDGFTLDATPPDRIGAFVRFVRTDSVRERALQLRHDAGLQVAVGFTASNSELHVEWGGFEEDPEMPAIAYRVGFFDCEVVRARATSAA